jgi:hypothetical protein
MIHATATVILRGNPSLPGSLFPLLTVLDRFLPLGRGLILQDKLNSNQNLQPTLLDADGEDKAQGGSAEI